MRTAGTLTEHNCAIQAVAERFPEICAAEAQLSGGGAGRGGRAPGAHPERLPRL